MIPRGQHVQAVGQPDERLARDQSILPTGPKSMHSIRSQARKALFPAHESRESGKLKRPCVSDVYWLARFGDNQHNVIQIQVHGAVCNARPPSKFVNRPVHLPLVQDEKPVQDRIQAAVVPH